MILDVLSKTERNYLSGIISPSSAHKRVLNHRINKKLRDFFNLEFPLIQNSDITEFSNVTECSNKNFIAEGTRRPFSGTIESLGRDSISRPNAYEAFALPG